MLISIAALILVTWLPVLVLRWMDPWSSAFMARATIDSYVFRDPNYRTDYRWVDFDRISPHVAVAVIAAEDQLFPFHGGFDYKSIAAAMERNEKSAKSRRPRVRGASTITQQVAKNLFLWPERSWFRKGCEAWFTLLIEFTWPKERILEVYLNIAEFGKGVYGVEAAAQRFWRKSAAQLTRAEGATLAAVLPSPRRLRANAPSRYVIARRDFIMAQMRGLGGPVYLRQLTEPTGPPAANPMGKSPSMARQTTPPAN